jgi:hypothetical protein
MDNSGWNMYVFRRGRRIVRGRDLLDALLKSLLRLASERNSETVLSALLAAGELECALADGDSRWAPVAAVATEAVARQLVRLDLGCSSNFKADLLADSIRQIEPPETVSISVHEGFAYYALHPLKFAHVIRRLSLPLKVGVVGIRSIGVALSAVTVAALQESGVSASRITVRPTGHPYDRFLADAPALRAWVQSFTEGQGESKFLVVDEGPGISGTSFLATAEAVERAGVGPRNIVLVGTRAPDPNGLRAPNGAARWVRFETATPSPEPYLPEGADIAIGGGVWREQLREATGQYPPSWTQLEPLKYLSADRRQFLRFEGYGHFGEAISERARRLADAEFSPAFCGNTEGFGRYEVLDGRPMSARDLTADVLTRLGEYCAFRAANFAAEISDCGELESMMRFNWQNEFQTELPRDIALSVVRPAITDSKMTPYEWLFTPEGKMFKTDAVSHGDGHFFPGPCDIAWDLAGAIVEWHMSNEQAEQLLAEYERVAKDDPRQRVGAYKLAYAVFHFAYAKMAAIAMGGTAEEPIFTAEYRHYRQLAFEIHEQLLAKRVAEVQEDGARMSRPLSHAENPLAA